MIQGIINARIDEEVESEVSSGCLEAIMPKPNLPCRSQMKDLGLVYVPFMEYEALDCFDSILMIWPRLLIDGIIAFQDHYELPTGPAPSPRIGKPVRLCFYDESAVKQGGYQGRYFLILGDEPTFIYIDYLDVSGICCHKDLVSRLIGTTLETHLGEMRSRVHELADSSERRYFDAVIGNAEMILR
jgi:hypothetical protein